MPRRSWHWLALAGAIAIEVAATTTMKHAALSGGGLAYLATFAAIAAAYALLALAVQSIPVALAYAVWESAGLVLVALGGAIAFGEALTPGRALAIAGIVVGAALLERGLRAPAAPAQEAAR